MACSLVFCFLPPLPSSPPPVLLPLLSLPPRACCLIHRLSHARDDPAGPSPSAGHKPLCWPRAGPGPVSLRLGRASAGVLAVLMTVGLTSVAEVRGQTEG